MLTYSLARCCRMLASVACSLYPPFSLAGLPSCLAGIIGAGRIGQVHLDTLASVPGVKPVIISDVVEPVLKMVTEKYGVPKYTMEVSYTLTCFVL